jgi:hypothetical protein
MSNFLQGAVTMRPIALLFALPFLTSCWTTSWESSGCPTIDVKVADPSISVTEHYRGPVYDTCSDECLLGDEGLPYQCRNPLLAEDTCFGPEEGESYTAYMNRMVATMQAMATETRRLKESILAKEVTNNHLGEQLAGLTQANHDFVAALSGQREQQRAPQNSAFSVYEVQKGDTLQAISYQAYNTYRGWLNIYRFNMDRLPHGPNQIEIGDLLLIPEAFDEPQML